MGILVKKDMGCNQLICPQCGNTGSHVELEVCWYQDFCSLLLGFITFPFYDPAVATINYN
uniref:OrfB_Zn_ribbon domain-containing protein n=1 Tax=Macrostomum lignano TaxID=282301 RepID=A0A1I8I0Y2_9PLAT